MTNNELSAPINLETMQGLIQYLENKKSKLQNDNLDQELQQLLEWYVGTMQQDKYLDLQARQLFFKNIWSLSTRGSHTALFLEGIMRAQGYGCKQDHEIAHASITMAAKSRQEPLALFFVGYNLLQQGNKKGLEYMHVASKLVANAAIALGFVYLFCPNIKQQNYSKAVEYYVAAGADGFPYLNKIKAYFKKLLKIDLVSANNSSALVSPTIKKNRIIKPKAKRMRNHK